MQREVLETKEKNNNCDEMIEKHEQGTRQSKTEYLFTIKWYIGNTFQCCNMTDNINTKLTV